LNFHPSPPQYAKRLVVSNVVIVIIAPIEMRAAILSWVIEILVAIVVVTDDDLI
jgi:hypothetical protein